MWFVQETGELMDFAVAMLDRFGQEAGEFMDGAVALVVMVMVKVFGVEVGFGRSVAFVDFVVHWVGVHRRVLFGQEVWKHGNLSGRARDKLRLLLVRLVGEVHRC